MRFLVDTVLDGIKKYSRDRGSDMAAGLSYYALFALPPLVTALLTSISILLADVRAQDVVMYYVSRLFDRHVSDVAMHIIAAFLRAGGAPWWMHVANFVLLALASSGVMVYLRRMFDRIWKITHRREGEISHSLSQRLVGLGLFAGVASFITIIVILDTAFIKGKDMMIVLFGTSALLLETTHYVVTFGLLLLSLTLTHRYIPSRPSPWDASVCAGVVTTMFFSIGRIALATYLSTTSLLTLFGASSSILMVFLWIYYAAVILFFGAEIGYCYDANRPRSSTKII